MRTQLSIPFLKNIGDTIRRIGDFLFILALLLSFFLALFIFYRAVYLPLYVPKPIPPAEPLFNIGLYNRVVGAVEIRETVIGEELADVPRSPFE